MSNINLPFVKKCISKLCFYISKFIANFIFKSMKIKDNYIVFESEGDFCDNSRAFYEYMIKNNYNKNYKLIWIVSEPKKYSTPKNVLFISKNKYLISGLKFFYYVYTSKYFLFTHPYWFTFKRENQTVINLCHGIPVKDGVNCDLSNSFDYILCSSENTKSWFNKVCGSRECQDVVLGGPRNDLMFESNNSVEKILKGKKYSKIILCMPTYKQTVTWIDSKKIIPYYIQGVNTPEELIQLNSFLSELKCILIIKIHHLQDISYLNNSNLSNIIYLNDEIIAKEDIMLYHILGQADVLLTDYSSVYLDYILLDRPIGFLLADLDDYTKGRGLLLDNYLDFMPGEKIYSIEDLKLFVVKVCKGIDAHSSERKAVRDYTNKYQDNKNCERLARFLKIKLS